MHDDDRPLFIPLAGKWYDQFADGTKRVEYRPYGARWNELTCRTGRRVTLSRGYGKKHRLHGHVTGFSVTDWTRATEEFRQLFPFEVQAACIRIALDPQPEPAK